MRTSKLYISFISLTLFFVFASGATTGMASLNPFKACTFSEMNVKLTLNGSPASGAKVIRSIQWQNESIDTFTSDSDGMATLPAKFENSITQVLPVEFISSQNITVEYQNKSYKIWVYAKRNPAENFEMNGSPFKLTCELSDELTLEEIFDSYLKTSCKISHQNA